MSNLKVASHTDGKTLFVSIEGEIKENKELPPIEVQSLSEIVVDLGKVDYINSAGVRTWINWIEDLRKSMPGASINFRRVPPGLMKQVATVVSFIPKEAKIKSAYVPYFCEKCNEESTRLIDLTVVDAQTKMIDVMSNAQCNECKSKLAIDAIPDQYVVGFERHR